jgi:hypothetical protein
VDVTAHLARRQRAAHIHAATTAPPHRTVGSRPAAIARPRAVRGGALVASEAWQVGVRLLVDVAWSTRAARRTDQPSDPVLFEPLQLDVTSGVWDEEGAQLMPADGLPASPAAVQP